MGFFDLTASVRMAVAALGLKMKGLKSVRASPRSDGTDIALTGSGGTEWDSLFRKNASFDVD